MSATPASAANLTTSFINNSADCVDGKPTLSSDSSIDSGCSAMTSSDSIHINQQVVGANEHLANNILDHNNQHRQDSRARSCLSMYGPQPSVPPPPPPPPLAQPHELYYGTSADQPAAIHQQHPYVVTNNNSNLYSENFYATFAQSSRKTPAQSNTSHPHQTKHQCDRTNSNSNSFQQTLKSQRLSSSSLESATSDPLMPINVKAMLLHGLPSEEVLRNWLTSLKCEEYIDKFMYHGYDMHLVTRMTPQDLAAVGCKSPTLRKKLLTEIKKLNLDFQVPEPDASMRLDRWLDALKLSQYYHTLCAEGFDTLEKACKVSWEDLEEIGINRLGHQKRLLLGIERVQKLVKEREESQSENPIYDTHPNHRVSLSGAQMDGRVGTLGRVRSGLFQTRANANLDHRGLPIATVVPALKHVNSPVLQVDTNQMNSSKSIYNTQVSCNNFGPSQIDDQPIYGSQANNYATDTMKLNEFASNTARRNLPPLPPVRTNSLKIGPDSESQNIYGSIDVPQNGVQFASQTVNSKSLFRTPKLGALTPTTNKMLASGVHMTLAINTLNKAVPVREAPPPPHQHDLRQPHMSYHQQNLLGTTIPEKVDEEQTDCQILQQPLNYPLPLNCDGTSLSAASVMGHQLADASEFPPPPPCQ